MKTYEYRKMRGICVACGEKPAEPGRVRCAECLAKEAEYVVLRRAEHPEIMKRSDIENAKKRETRAERARQGLCTECGRKAWNGTKLCMDCCLKARERAKRWRDRNRGQTESQEQKLARLRARAEEMRAASLQKNREWMDGHWRLVHAKRVTGANTWWAATSGDAGSASIGGG